MGYNKKTKEKFLKAIEYGKMVMPFGIINVKQYSLFDEPENNDHYKVLNFALRYPPMDKNVNGDPMAKQSMRTMVRRDKEGNVMTFTNPKTGKLDVFTQQYQEAKLTQTADVLQLQLQQQLSKKYIGFRPFYKDVHILRAEFIFSQIASLSKSDEEAIASGDWIVFKETEPDLDNLEKMLWDVMQAAGIFTNDARIVSKNGIFKRYGTIPGIIVELEGRV
jgi:Holliday junction resolvase RusA-like endonuclease